MRLPPEKAAAVHSGAEARSRRGYSALAKTLTLVTAITHCIMPCCAATGVQNANVATARPAPFTALGTWNGLRVMGALLQKYETDRRAHFVKFMPIVTEQVAGCLSRHQCDVGMILDSRVPETSKNDIGSYQSFMVGRFVVGVAANSKNRVRTITLDDLQNIFTGQTVLWKDLVGSENVAHIEICRPSATSTPGMIFRKTVLLRCPSSHTMLEPCADARPEKKSDAEVVGAIIKQSNAIGFLLYHSEEQMDKRIRILRIAKDKDSEAVPPSASTVADGSYPLVDTLTLYLHPDAPASAREFCEFATGSEGAKIIKECGLWPEHGLEKVRGQQRLGEVKAGKGTEIVVCDLAGYEDTLKDLSLEFVKAKAAVQLKFQKGEMRDTAIEKLNKGATELLLADGPLATPKGDSPIFVERKSGQSPPKSPAEKGTVPGTLQGEGQSPPQSLAEKGTVPGTLQGEGQSPFPRSIELGRMAVGVIVHPENPLESLPMDEARAIFCGEIKKWPAVRGAAAAMHVFGLRNTNPIAQLLKESFNRDPKGSARPATLKCTAQPDSEKVILAVARDPAAIGFVDMSQLPPNEKSVKLVPVFERRQGDSPIFVERKLGQSPIPNPLSRTLTLYVSPNASQTAKDFAEFLTPEHCKETIAQYNLLPPLHAEEAKLAKATPARERPQIDLASANEPPPLLLDDPDAPESKQRSKREGKAKPSRPAVAQVGVSQEDSPPPSQPKPAKSRPTPPPTSQSPNDFALSDNQLVALLGIGGGVIVLALVIVGRLRAPKGKRLRR